MTTGMQDELENCHIYMLIFFWGGDNSHKKKMSLNRDVHTTTVIYWLTYNGTLLSCQMSSVRYRFSTLIWTAGHFGLKGW